jgi:hypothetical protein
VAQSGTKKTKVAQKKPNRHKKTKVAQKKPKWHKAAQKKPKKPSWPNLAQTGTKWPQLGPTFYKLRVAFVRLVGICGCLRAVGCSAAWWFAVVLQVTSCVGSFRPSTPPVHVEICYEKTSKMPGEIRL